MLGDSNALVPEQNQVTEKDSPKFGFPVPIDPLRLIAGVLTRWPWILVSLVIFTTTGVYFGIKMTHQTYALSVALMKRRVPETVQASEIGQAYRPSDLNDATLLATLLATEPIDRACKLLKYEVDSGALKKLLEAKQLEGTDIFYITYHSPISPEDAVKFTTTWANEINAYTRRLQQTEADEVRALLQKEVESLEEEIRMANDEIMNFSREENYLGGNSQVEAVLGKLSQIELQLEEARTQVESKKEQIAAMTEQIGSQSPVEYQLKIALEELANLRSTYTDQNPLVLSKLQTIAFLEIQVKKLKEAGLNHLEPYTGTPLGNQIYLSIMGINNELFEAERRLASLKVFQEETTKKLVKFPAIISRYDALLKKRDSHFEGLTLMKNRLKETEIFASGSPGYWQVFQKPDLRNIIPSSLIKKPAILGFLGAVSGFGLAVLLTLLLTQRSSRRSILECCASTRAPLICFLPTTLEEDARSAIENFWITHVSPHLEHSSPILFWTSSLQPEDERRLWSILANVIHNDTGKPMRVLDLTPDQLWNEQENLETLIWLDHQGEDLDLNDHLFTRAVSLPSHELRKDLIYVQHWISVVSGEKLSLRKARKIRQITDAYLPPCGGTIAWIERPEGRIRELVDVLSTILAKHFSYFPKS